MCACRETFQILSRRLLSVRCGLIRACREICLLAELFLGAVIDPEDGILGVVHDLVAFYAKSLVRRPVLLGRILFLPTEESRLLPISDVRVQAEPTIQFTPHQHVKEEGAEDSAAA